MYNERCPTIPKEKGISFEGHLQVRVIVHISSQSDNIFL